jgi:hypothetical protein
VATLYLDITQDLNLKLPAAMIFYCTGTPLTVQIVTVLVTVKTVQIAIVIADKIYYTSRSNYKYKK